MKIAFFGTPEFASDILRGLLGYQDIEVVLVVSQPDKAVGRKRELVATPVKQVALNAGIGVLQPESLKRDQSLETILKRFNLDFIVVVAYGKIIPKSILEIPKYGCINLHGSILPKYRGASPVQAALRDGLSETGLTTMFMSERMDEGDILEIAKIKVDTVDKSPDIFQKFTRIGPELLRSTLLKVYDSELSGTPQNHAEAMYCGKISKEDGEVSFTKQGAEEIYNFYRAYTPWPGIFTFYEGKRLVIEGCCFDVIGDFEREYDGDIIIGSFIRINKKFFGIICADKKFLVITQVKPEGKKSMDIESFINGNKKVLEYIFD
ncbi:methionyl-tRNA formyltransferase [Candidatus Gracilibacteria bacterium]|nr:methionyl-tRNA formyltransferase [Candidatus Gracilibacteria bacterium]